MKGGKKWSFPFRDYFGEKFYRVLPHSTPSANVNRLPSPMGSTNVCCAQLLPITVSSLLGVLTFVLSPLPTQWIAQWQPLRRTKVRLEPVHSAAIKAQL